MGMVLLHVCECGRHGLGVGHVGATWVLKDDEELLVSLLYYRVDNSGDNKSTILKSLLFFFIEKLKNEM